MTDHHQTPFMRFADATGGGTGLSIGSVDQ